MARPGLQCRHYAETSYPPELRLTRQKGCIGDGSRVADIVVGMEETTMCAVTIRDEVSPQELRRRARQESDGRVAARLFAIANALEGMDRASAARLAGIDRQTLRDWVHRYNEAGIAGLGNRRRRGRSPKLVLVCLGLVWRRRGLQGRLRRRTKQSANQRNLLPDII